MLSKTKIAKELLAEAIPGGYDASLEDRVLIGPRGELVDFRRVAGAEHAGGPVVAMAVCGPKRNAVGKFVMGTRTTSTTASPSKCRV
jgi:hypothetical protein